MSLDPNTDGLRPEEFPMEPFPEEKNPSEQLRRRVYIGFGGCIAVGLAVAGLYIGGRLFAKPRPKWEPVTVSNAAHPAGLPKASPLGVSKVEPRKAETAKVEPMKTDTGKAEPPKTETATAEPSKSEPAKTEAPKIAAKTEPVKPEPVKVVPAQSKQPEPKTLLASNQAPPSAKAQLVAQTTNPPGAKTQGGVWNLVTPKTGDRYLQLAALGPSYTDKYVAALQTKGIRASVAAGPTGDIYRIVVGPFSDRAALERQLDALEAAGIQPMLRVY